MAGHALATDGHDRAGRGGIRRSYVGSVVGRDWVSTGLFPEPSSPFRCI